MTDENDAGWAPPGADDPGSRPSSPSPSNPLVPPHPFSPEAADRVAAEEAAQAIVSRVAPAAAEPSTPPGAPTVATLAVGPVGAASESHPGRFRRGAAALVAVLLISGGGYAALSAGSASGGAESPEQALELMLAAISDGDYLAAMEYLVPSERDTLFQAGLDAADELVRLDVLADDLDLGGLRGVEFDFINLQIRHETPRVGLAHLFVDGGTVTASVDVSSLPLGSIITDRASEDFLTFSDRDTTVVQGAPGPLVAVERDGRWYLSLWYLVAENARLTADLGLPDAGRRPASIGAATPEAAVDGFVEELTRLDIRRMIGMLDPVEAEALYDYAPLFLDQATTSANELLDSLDDEGWVWAIDDLALTSAGDAERARVSINGLSFSATNDAGHVLDLEFSADHVRLALRSADFWGEPYSVDVVSDGDCFTVAYSDAESDSTEETCADEVLAPLGSGVLGGFDRSESLALSVHRVDGRWFISPTGTVTDLYLAILRNLDADALTAMIDGFEGIFESFDEGSLAFPGLFERGRPLIERGEDPGRAEPASGPDNLDLVVGGVDPTFAYDDDTGAELEWWLPQLEAPRIDRGVYASVATDSGEAALVVYELSAPLASPLDDLLTGALLSGTSAASVPFVYVQDPFGEDLMVAVDGTRLVIVGTYGAALTDMEKLLVAQFG